jgi:uncharacterized protein with PIN domain
MLCVCNYDEAKLQCPLCNGEILSFFIPEIDEDHTIIENLSICICPQCRKYEVVLWDKHSNELMRKARSFGEPFKICHFVERAKQ